MKNRAMAAKTFFGVLLFTLMFVLESFAAPDIKMIDTAQFHSMIMDSAYRLEGGREKQFVVIDARTKEEYNEAHVFSAISIPERDFERFMALLPKDKRIQLIVYCDDSNLGTSTQWARKAGAHGYANIVIYSGGFSAWKARQMPTAPLNPQM